jgi:hypothetical protein
MDWIISLWSSSVFWEWVEYVAEAIVIAGAVVEVLTDFKHILKGEEDKDLRERVGKYAAIVLIFGLCIELFALARTNQLFNEIIASLTIEARDANTRAETAFNQATAAVKRGNPRIIDTAKFLGRLKGKPKRTVTLLYHPDDTEAYMFAEQITGALRRGGWKATEPRPIPASGGNKRVPNAPGQIRYGTMAGVGMTFVAKNVRGMLVDDRSAFQALSLAVSSSLMFGPPAVAWAERDDPALPDGTFLVVIGQKM